MPFKLLLQVLITLFVAAVIFAVATGQFPFPANQEPIVLQGGSRMASGISMDAETKMDEAQSDAVHLVVQFGHYLTPTDERTLERQYDVQILEAVPEFAYVLALPGDQARAILLQMMNGTPAVKAVVSIRDQDRLSPSLGTIANPLLPEHAVTTIEESDDYDWRLVPGAVVRPVISSSYPAMDTQVLRLIVHFFSDVIRDDQKEILGSVGATFSGDVKQPNAAHGQWWVNIKPDQVTNLLNIDAVRWVEAIPRPPVPDLHEARGAVDFDGSAGGGSGVLIAQWEVCQPHTGMANHVDPEFRNDHEGLAGRISYRRTVNSPDSCGDQLDSHNMPRSWHPTMVAGIMVGTPVSDNDVPATIPLQESLYGMASGAHIIAYRVHDQSASQNADYSDAIGKGATISQNSWGSGCEIYQDSDIGPYLLSSAQFDRVSSGVNYLGMSSGYGGRMLVVTSAGNYGDETAVTSLWRSARVSNSAKNALVVGNVNTQDKSKTSHWAHVSSGRGPTTDGRISPLISAPGIRLDQPSVPQTLPGNNQTTLIHKGIYSTYPANNYRGDFWGTSFSAPMVSGAAALATETYQGTCPTDPSPMELRALLLHTAHDLKEAESTLGSQVKSELIGGNCSYLGGTAAGSTDAQFGLNPEFQVQSGPVYEGPDYIYGYGLLQTEAARDFIRQSHFTTGTISRGYVEYDINVQPADLEDNQLRVTLAWDDPPWPINIPPSSRHGLLQNDLDLELIDPSGRRHLPWVLDPDNPSKPAQQHTGSPFCCVTREMRDQRNTVEQVQVEVNEFGTWTIRVRAGLMIRPAQEFTLVSRAISPQTDCGDLPSRLVEYPFELPDSRLMCWLLWLAIAVLVLMILILFWLIWTSYSNQPGGHPPWLYMLAALILLALVFYVLLLQMWLVLAVLIILLLSLFVVLT